MTLAGGKPQQGVMRNAKNHLEPVSLDTLAPEPKWLLILVLS